MKKAKRRIVVTSALPYANGDIHIGHLVEYLQTDFWVRFQKMQQHECLYVCADDTHGTPVMLRARQEGITPEELIRISHAQHTRDFADFEIEFDNYYTTHSKENQEFCNRIYSFMVEKNTITTHNLPQLYCEHDQMFLPDRFVKGSCPLCNAPEQYGDACEVCSQTYAAEELIDPYCAICNNPPVTRESEHLFFELEPLRDFLAQWIPRHTTPEVANKLLEWFQEPLRSWCISRDAPYFGFEIPDKPGKFFYVWMDAPIGYMASLQNWCEQHNQEFDAWWQSPDAELYHFIGKDIVRFHSLFWPAMLHTAGYKTPTKVFVHGFLTVNGEKMSKSRGTFIKARTYIEHLNPQDLRFYYACKLNSSADDIDLNLEDFANRVNADLVGKITNLASRSAQMLHKRLEGRLGTMDRDGAELHQRVVAKADQIAADYEAREFSKVMTAIRTLADHANVYFDTQAPWLLIKSEPEAAREIITAVLNIFRVLAIYLQPILPGYAAKVAQLFSESPYCWEAINTTITQQTINAYEYLATRVDNETVSRMVEDSRGEK